MWIDEVYGYDWIVTTYASKEVKGGYVGWKKVVSEESQYQFQKFTYIIDALSSYCKRGALRVVDITVVKDNEALTVQLDSGLSLQCFLDPRGRVKLIQADTNAKVEATLVLNNEHWVIDDS